MENLLSLDFHVWFANFVNVAAAIFGLTRIVKTRDVQGQSFVMWSCYLYVQCVFACVGYSKQIHALLFGMVISALISVTILVLIARWRR